MDAASASGGSYDLADVVDAAGAAAGVLGAAAGAEAVLLVDSELLGDEVDGAAGLAEE